MVEVGVKYLHFVPVYLVKQPLLEWFLYKNCIKSILGKSP